MILAGYVGDRGIHKDARISGRIEEQSAFAFVVEGSCLNERRKELAEQERKERSHV